MSGSRQILANISRRELLDVAVELSWLAGRITLRYFQTGVVAERKADASPVTPADRETERCLRDEIARRFPEDAIIGEEFGADQASRFPGSRSDGSGGGGSLAHSGRRRWIVDPIDGTRSFVRGVPFYGVLLAVEMEGEVIVGVLHFPALAETVYAARGEGCWWNGRPARVSAVSTLAEAALLTTDAERLHGNAGWDQLRKEAGITRTWGDCYGHALVATGRAEIMLDPTAALWDSAALQPVIEEAGGVFTDWRGARRHDGGSAVSTNAALAGAVRSSLNANGNEIGKRVE